MTDPYLDPDSGVLLNRLGITDAQQLRQVEADLTLAALQDLSTRALPGAYDLAHLQAFHHEIFDDIYPWAGQIRTVAIAKTDLFCLPQHIEHYATGVFDELAKERYLRGLQREQFVDRLTHYFAEVNAIHPFREGNGRTQRAFFRQLSHDAGRPINWSQLDPVQTNTHPSNPYAAATRRFGPSSTNSSPARRSRPDTSPETLQIVNSTPNHTFSGFIRTARKKIRHGDGALLPRVHSDRTGAADSHWRPNDHRTYAGQRPAECPRTDLSA